jgi:hypothetical protein
MLRPTKFSHPDKTVIAVATLVLERLMDLRIERLDDLRAHLKTVDRGLDVLFLPAVSVLYLLGLIEYHVKTDSLEYTAKHETL